MSQAGILAGLHTPAPAQAQVVLRNDGQPLAQWDAEGGPAELWRGVLPLGPYSLTGWDLQVWQGGDLQAVIAGAVQNDLGLAPMESLARGD